MLTVVAVVVGFDGRRVLDRVLGGTEEKLGLAVALTAAGAVTDALVVALAGGTSLLAIGADVAG